MNGKWLGLFAAGLIGLVTFAVFSSITSSLGRDFLTVDPKVETHILSATVQIRMFVPYNPSAEPSTVKQFVMARGLGTLTNLDSETVIVTHDHWGDALLEAAFVRFYDAQGVQELELSGDDFRALIRYQDPGTLILIAPLPLVTAHPLSPAIIGKPYDVAAGSTLVIARCDPAQEDRVALLVVRVVECQPAFKVRSLDGQPFVIPGDSGGGIWQDGELIGNMWARSLVDEAETGFVAQFPMEQVHGSLYP